MQRHATQIIGLLAWLFISSAAAAQGQFVEEANDSYATEPDVQVDAEEAIENADELPQQVEQEEAPLQKRPPDFLPTSPRSQKEIPSQKEKSAHSAKVFSKKPETFKNKTEKNKTETNKTETNKSETALEKRAGPAEGIVIRQLSFAGVLERWDAFRRADRAQESAKAKRFETLLNDGLRDFGIQGLPLRPQLLPLAKARTQEAEQALQNQDLARALLAATEATRLAPDKPQTHLFLARIKMAANDSAGAILHFRNAVKALERDPISVVYGLFYAGLVLLMALLLFFTVFILLFLLRGFRYVAFDLHSILPRGATKGQIYLLLGIALILPVTLRVGPVFLGLIWTTAVFLYLTRKEQAFILLLGPLLVASPFGIHVLGVLGAYQGSRIERAYTALQDATAQDVRASLKKTKKEQLLLPELMALGFEAKREGRLEEALNDWRQVVQRFSNNGSGHVNLGVISALLGREEFALASFKKALALAPEHTEAEYNISLIYNRNKNPKKAASFTESLQAGNGDLLEAYRAITFRGSSDDVPHNRAFVDGYYDMNVLKDLFEHPPSAAVHIEQQLRATLFLGLEKEASAGAIGLFVLLWLGLLGTRKKFIPSAPCQRCGTPASSRYDAENCTEGICTGCFNIFDSTGVRIEASRRIAKEYQAKAFRGRRRWAGLLLSLLWPGLGLLWVRASFRGFILAVLYYPSLVLILFGLGYILWPDLTPQIASDLALGIGVTLSVLLQLFGLRLVLSETE